jgi:hypothetical protein
MLIWVENEAEYLFSQDWTGQISLIRHEKLDFGRGAITQPFRMRNALPGSACIVRARAFSDDASHRQENHEAKRSHPRDGRLRRRTMSTAPANAELALRQQDFGF